MIPQIQRLQYPKVPDNYSIHKLTARDPSLLLPRLIKIQGQNGRNFGPVSVLGFTVIM